MLLRWGVTLLGILMPLAVLAQPTPVIDFDRVLGTCGNTNTTEFTCAKTVFSRSLGETKEQIIDKNVKTFYKPSLIKRSSLDITKQVDLFVLKLPEEDSTSAFYVMEKKKSVGFCLFDRLDIPPQFSSDTDIVAIKALPTLPNHLSGQIVTSPKLTITFYQAQNNTHVERYAMLKTVLDQEEMLVLDCFYPKSIENQIQGPIATHLNIIINRFIRLYP